MKKIILIVEDKPEEFEKAKAVVSENSDYRAIVVSDLESFNRLFGSMKDILFGVITDLHFPVNDGLKEGTKNNPNGLSVVALCVENNVRVAICSDINHHYCQYVDGIVQVLKTHQRYTFGSIPFSQDSKEWATAINNLLHL